MTPMLLMPDGYAPPKRKPVASNPGARCWVTSDGRQIPYREMADNHLINAYRWVVAQARCADNARQTNAILRHWRPALNALRKEIDRRGLSA